MKEELKLNAHNVINEMMAYVLISQNQPPILLKTDSRLS